MAAQATTESVEKEIFEGLGELGADRDAISREATFEELEVDSLDIVELSQIIEEKFGVELEGDDVKDLKSVGEVVDLVVARAA